MKKISEHVRKLRFQTRGQITIFIIFGLVLLLALSYFIFIRQESLHEIEKIQPELIPVQSYIETCMYNLGKEAVTILGLNGGYIDFPLDIEANPEKYLSTGPVTTYKNPYWWHDGIERIPTQVSMEAQISNYANANLPACLNKFEAFSNVYDIVEHGGVNTLTEIGNSMDSIVKIETRYPIEIKDKFGKTLAELTNFRVEIPVRLYAAYTLANRIMEAENEQGFVERKVISLISLDDDIPDTGGPKFQCSKLKWGIPEINSKIRMLMSENLPFIKIKGSKFNQDRTISIQPMPHYEPIPDRDTPEYELEYSEPIYSNSYFNSHYILDVGDEDWSNMRTSFTYDYNWPLHWVNDFYIRPNDYPNLYSNSQTGGDMLSFVCMHIWHFTYDMKFPVKVTIVDEETAKNDEYSFIFAFRGSIDHNEPKRERFSSIDFGVENIVENDEFCSDHYDNLRIYATDETTRAEINDVELTLVCGKFKCELGLTEADYSAGGIRYWQGSTPRCMPGVLRAKKQGYADAEMLMQTDTVKIHHIYMDPVKEFENFIVLKHEVKTTSTGTVVYPNAEELAEGESALITLKLSEEELEKDFEETVVYPFDETTEEGETQKLGLLAKKNYEYDVEIYLMDDTGILGGYKGKWTPYKEDIDKRDKIEFHVVYNKEFTDEESQLAEMALFFTGLESYSKSVKEPQLIKIIK